MPFAAYDDNGRENAYPLVRVQAKNAANSGDGDDSCLTYKALVLNQPAVCQTCHCTPALDRAHVGPKAGPAGSEANGRNQVAHQSNSRVMHNNHGTITARGRNGVAMFRNIPAPTHNAGGVVTNQPARLTALENSCYQCHPGTNVQCLRGAMFNGDMLCSDCHSSMLQVGADFSAGVSPTSPGAFVLDQGNFYTPGSSQPRVPWANEPGCGSCHTGDVNNRLTGNNLLVNTADTNGNTDNIRLRQAYRDDDAKATPIVPTNKRFAEPEVHASEVGLFPPGRGVESPSRSPDKIFAHCLVVHYPRNLMYRRKEKPMRLMTALLVALACTPAAADEYSLDIDNDLKAEYFVVEKAGTPEQPTLLVKRVRAGTTSYSLRLFDCEGQSYKKLGSADSVEALADVPLADDLVPAQEDTIAYQLWEHACGK